MKFYSHENYENYTHILVSRLKKEVEKSERKKERNIQKYIKYGFPCSDYDLKVLWIS